MKKSIVFSLVLVVFFGTSLFGGTAGDGNSQAVATPSGENQQKAEAGKFKIGIAEIKYKAQRSENDKDRQAYGNRTPQEDTQAFIDMLTTAIAKTKKFDIIERDRMADILKEQSLGDADLVEKESAQKLGTIKGVDYIVIGAITEYGMESKGAAFKDFATTKSKAIMAVDIRILDAATGKIAIAETVSESKKASSGVAAAGVNVAEQNEKVLSDVMRQCADSIGNLIVSTLYPVKIISISADGIIMLNYGNGYLNAGEVLDVFSQGKIVKDPDTGEILGAEEQKVGRINVSDVQAKFSKATAIQGAEGLAKGMICRKVPQKQLEDEKKSEKQKNKKELQ